MLTAQGNKLGTSVKQEEALTSFRGSLMTSTDESKALWDKKRWRFYHEFNADVTLKFTSTKDFILQFQQLTTFSGSCRAVIKTGGTEGGSFDTPVTTIFNKNTIGGEPASPFTVLSGGTQTGGTEREVLRSDSGTGGGVASLGTAVGWRLLPAGTFYIFLDTSGTPSGQYNLEVEELDTVGGV